MRNNRKIMPRRRSVRRVFTLMEVLVAMAVFTVMMTILLNFFVGTQKLWSGTDSKNELYADARVAMDLFASTLQSQFYDHGSSMFLFGSADTKRDAILFPVKMPVDYGSDEELYYLVFWWRKADHTLYLRTCGKKDDANVYKNLFSSSVSAAEKATLLRTNLGTYAAPGSSNPSRKVIDGVWSISFTPVHADLGETDEDKRVKFYSDYDPLPSEMSFGGFGDVREVVPFGVRISMQMLGKQQWQEWLNMGVDLNEETGEITTEPDAAKAFRLANTRQFDRIIYLGFK